jgi:hypothetical protein
MTIGLRQEKDVLPWYIISYLENVIRFRFNDEYFVYAGFSGEEI